MKCPNCDFIDKDEAFGQPPQCPSCGVFYDKALKVAELKEKLRRERAAKEKPGLAPLALKQGVTSAAVGVAETRAEATDNANEIVITGIRIPFWRLVLLLVKLVLASIPAIIILWVLFSVIMAIPEAVRSYNYYSERAKAETEKSVRLTPAMGESSEGMEVPKTEQLLSLVMDVARNPAEPQVVQYSPSMIHLTLNRNPSSGWKAALVVSRARDGATEDYGIVTDCKDRYGVLDLTAGDEHTQRIFSEKIRFIDYKQSMGHIKIKNAICR